MYKAVDLAKYVVFKCVQDKVLITNLQLQKILYYLRREFLREGIHLFYDDIEAWKFGPVVPNVYYEFCTQGSLPINIALDDWGDLNIDSVSRKIIDRIVEDKRSLNPWDMVSDTHKEGGAWSITYDSGKGYKKIITPDLIKNDK